MPEASETPPSLHGSPPGMVGAETNHKYCMSHLRLYDLGLKKVRFQNYCHAILYLQCSTTHRWLPWLQTTEKVAPGQVKLEHTEILIQFPLFMVLKPVFAGSIKG